MIGPRYTFPSEKDDADLGLLVNQTTDASNSAEFRSLLTVFYCQSFIVGNDRNKRERGACFRDMFENLKAVPLVWSSRWLRLFETYVSSTNDPVTGVNTWADFIEEGFPPSRVLDNLLPLLSASVSPSQPTQLQMPMTKREDSESALRLVEICRTANVYASIASQLAGVVRMDRLWEVSHERPVRSYQPSVNRVTISGSTYYFVDDDETATETLKEAAQRLGPGSDSFKEGAIPDDGARIWNSSELVLYFDRVSDAAVPVGQKGKKIKSGSSGYTGYVAVPSAWLKGVVRRALSEIVRIEKDTDARSNYEVLFWATVLTNKALEGAFVDLVMRSIDKKKNITPAVWACWTRMQEANIFPQRDSFGPPRCPPGATRYEKAAAESLTKGKSVTNETQFVYFKSEILPLIGPLFCPRIFLDDLKSFIETWFLASNLDSEPKNASEMRAPFKSRCDRWAVKANESREENKIILRNIYLSTERAVDPVMTREFRQFLDKLRNCYAVEPDPDWFDCWNRRKIDYLVSRDAYFFSGGKDPTLKYGVEENKKKWADMIDPSLVQTIKERNVALLTFLTNNEEDWGRQCSLLTKIERLKTEARNDFEAAVSSIFFADYVFPATDSI